MGKNAATVTPMHKSLSYMYKGHVRQFSWNWVGRGYLVAVTGSTWLLWGLCGWYGVYVPVTFPNITLRVFHRTDLSEGVTVAYKMWTHIWIFSIKCENSSRWDLWIHIRSSMKQKKDKWVILKILTCKSNFAKYVVKLSTFSHMCKFTMKSIDTPHLQKSQWKFS